MLALFLAVSGMCYGCITFFHAAIDNNPFLCSATAMMAIYFSKFYFLSYCMIESSHRTNATSAQVNMPIYCV